MSWIAVGVAGVSLIGGGAKAVQANQAGQRNKGIIGKAYGLARQRQTEHQQDVRQGSAESLWARGLGQGGGAAVGVPTRTAVPKTAAGVSPIAAAYQPHSLGEQMGADNEREFGFEREDLNSREDMAKAGVSQQASAGVASGIADGVTGAVSSYNGVQKPAGLDSNAASPIASAYGKGVMVDTPPPVSSPYTNSFGGIDPVDPLGRGAWSGGGTTGGFTAFNQDVA